VHRKLAAKESTSQSQRDQPPHRIQPKPSQTACPATARFSPADKAPQPRRQQDVLTRPEDPDSPAQPAATSLPLAPVPETLVVHADHLSSPQRNHNSYPVGNPPPSQQHGAEAVRGSSGDEVLSSSAQNASVRSRARSGGTPSHNTWLGPPLEQSPQKASHSRARSEVARPAAEDNMHGALPSIYQNSSTRAISGSGGGGETEMQEELAHNWGRSVPDGTRLEAASSEARSRQSSRGSGSNTPTLPKLVEPKAEAQRIDSSAESADPLMSEATVSKIVAEEMARLNSDRRWSMTRFGQQSCGTSPETSVVYDVPRRRGSREVSLEPIDGPSPRGKEKMEQEARGSGATRADAGISAASTPREGGHLTPLTKKPPAQFSPVPNVNAMMAKSVKSSLSYANRAGSKSGASSSNKSSQPSSESDMPFYYGTTMLPPTHHHQPQHWSLRMLMQRHQLAILEKRAARSMFRNAAITVIKGGPSNVAIPAPVQRNQTLPGGARDHFLCSRASSDSIVGGNSGPYFTEGTRGSRLNPASTSNVVETAEQSGRLADMSKSVESVENTSSKSLGSSDLNSCPYGPESDVNEHHRVAYAALDAIQERKISERISVTC